MGEDLTQLQESLKRSFQRIKDDILNHESQLKKLSQQIKTLSEMIQNHSKKPSAFSPKRIRNLQAQITSLEKKLQKVRQPEIQPVLERISELTRRQDLIETETAQQTGQSDSKTEHLLQKIDEKLSSWKQPRADIPSLVKEAVAQALQSLNQSQKKSQRDPETPFASRMIKKLERNKKDIIKQRIIEMVTQAPMLLPELKEILVDEKQYCSKASFYRYIEDLLHRGIIAFDQKGESNIVILKGRARP